MAVLALAHSLYEGAHLLKNPEPVLMREAGAMSRAAHRLREIDDGSHGRILCPWDWGHLVSYTAGLPVMVDGFGTAGGLTSFQEAQSAYFLIREEALARYCQRNGIRFVVLNNPFQYFPYTVHCFGVPSYHYLRPSLRGDGIVSVTRLMQASFWWRAYFDHGLARPEKGAWGASFRFFRLVYSDPQASSVSPPFGGPLVQVWELTH